MAVPSGPVGRLNGLKEHAYIVVLTGFHVIARNFSDALLQEVTGINNAVALRVVKASLVRMTDKEEAEAAEDEDEGATVPFRQRPAPPPPCGAAGPHVAWGRHAPGFGVQSTRAPGRELAPGTGALSLPARARASARRARGARLWQRRGAPHRRPQPVAQLLVLATPSSCRRTHTVLVSSYPNRARVGMVGTGARGGGRRRRTQTQSRSPTRRDGVPASTRVATVSRATFSPRRSPYARSPSLRVLLPRQSPGATGQPPAPQTNTTMTVFIFPSAEQ